MNIKRKYLKVRLKMRTVKRAILENFGEMLLYTAEESPTPDMFNRMYQICVAYHGMCLFMFNYQLK